VSVVGATEARDRADHGVAVRPPGKHGQQFTDMVTGHRRGDAAKWSAGVVGRLWLGGERLGLAGTTLEEDEKASFRRRSVWPTLRGVLGAQAVSKRQPQETGAADL